MNKPGIATTEFWVHNVLQLLTIVQTLLGHIKPEAAAWVGAAMGITYMVSRAVAKFGDAMSGYLPAEPAPDNAAGASVGGSTGGTVTALGVLLLAACLLMPAGCAQYEINRVSQSVVATTEQAKIAQQLHDGHVTTPAQEARIAELLRAQAKAEDAYYASIRAGDSTAMKTAKEAWAAAVSAASTELAKYKLPATQPATRPGI